MSELTCQYCRLSFPNRMDLDNHSLHCFHFPDAKRKDGSVRSPHKKPRRTGPTLPNPILPPRTESKDKEVKHRNSRKKPRGNPVASLLLLHPLPPPLLPLL